MRGTAERSACSRLMVLASHDARTWRERSVSPTVGGLRPARLTCRRSGLQPCSSPTRRTSRTSCSGGRSARSSVARTSTWVRPTPRLRHVRPLPARLEGALDSRAVPRGSPPRAAAGDVVVAAPPTGASPVAPLDDVEASFDGRTIHVTIDVAGRESDALAGLDLRRWRPWVLVVAATMSDRPEPAHRGWERRGPRVGVCVLPLRRGQPVLRGRAPPRRSPRASLLSGLRARSALRACRRRGTARSARTRDRTGRPPRDGEQRPPAAGRDDRGRLVEGHAAAARRAWLLGRSVARRSAPPGHPTPSSGELSAAFAARSSRPASGARSRSPTRPAGGSTMR